MSGDDNEPTTIAVVLAAGAGSRFAGPDHKLRTLMGEHTIAAISIAVAIDSRIGPVHVITGAAELELERDPRLRDHVTTVHNPDWQQGQATSLQAAVREARRVGAQAIVVGLADQPFVTSQAWRRVAESTSPIAVATYDGAPRNPVRLHRSIWHLLPTTGDSGARGVARVRPDLVEQIPCPGSPADIDTLEDLQQWQSRSSTNSS